MESKHVVKTIAVKDGEQVKKSVVIPSQMTESDTAAKKKELEQELGKLFRYMLNCREDVWNELMALRSDMLLDFEGKVLPDPKSMMADAVWERIGKEEDIVGVGGMSAMFPHIRICKGTIDRLGLISHAWFRAEMSREELNEPSWYWILDPMAVGCHLIPQPVNSEAVMADMLLIHPWGPFREYYTEVRDND